jgi:hypothetical protein
MRLVEPEPRRKRRNYDRFFLKRRVKGRKILRMQDIESLVLVE